MKNEMKRMLGVLSIAVAGATAMSGCGNRSETQSTDSYGSDTTHTNRMDDSMRDGAREAGEATRDATGRAMERTGEALDNAGDSMQETGEEMQR